MSFDPETDAQAEAEHYASIKRDEAYEAALMERLDGEGTHVGATYDWRKDADEIRRCARFRSTGEDSICIRLIDRLAAYIERLEAERDALLREHEAWKKHIIEEGMRHPNAYSWEQGIVAAHDEAEKVLKGAKRP